MQSLEPMVKSAAATSAGTQRGSTDDTELANGSLDHPAVPCVSIVIPVFNGETIITDRVRVLLSHLDAQPTSSELIVVDDGSTDDTPGCLGRIATHATKVRFVTLRHERNRGKGAAIVTGMRAARGSCRVFADADDAYAPSEIDRVVAALTAGAQVAVASRVHPDSRLLIRPGNLPYMALRFIIGRILYWMVRPALRLNLGDTQAGLKGFQAPIAQQLFQGWLPPGFSFDLALLFRARRLGFRIEEVPVLQCSLNEPTTVRLLRDTATMVRDVAQIRLGLIEDHFEAWDSALQSRRRHVVARLRQLILSRHVPAFLVALGVSATFVLLMARHVWGSIPLALSGWATMIATVLVAAWRANSRSRPRRHAWFRNTTERRVFAVLLTLCAVVRFVWLDDLPPMMHGDSAWCGNLGLMALRGRVADVFDFSGWYYTPYFSFLPYAASFFINGVSVFALRLPSAVLGTLVLPPLYFLTRTWFGARPAALAAFLYAVGHASVHFSRIGLWNVQVAFYGVAAFALICSALYRRCHVRMATAGVLSGLALYSYTGGRQIPLVILLYLAGEARRTRRIPAGLGYYVLAMAVVVLPLIGNYVRDPNILRADRTAAVWALSESARPHVEDSLGVRGAAAIVREQVSRTIRGFVSIGDASTQYETTQPILSWPTALLGCLGLLAALIGWRQPRHQFLLLWLGLGLLLGSVLVIDPPSYTRFVLIFPAVYILVAVGLESLLRLARKEIHLGRVEIALVIGVVALQSAVFNLTGYYRFTQQVAQMPREWDVLKVVERLGVGHDIYLFTGPLLLSDSAIFQLFSADTRTVSGFSPADVPATLSNDTAFILTPEYRGAGRIITQRFPGAEREVVDVNGVRQLAVYHCTTANACRGAS